MDALSTYIRHLVQQKESRRNQHIIVQWGRCSDVVKSAEGQQAFASKGHAEETQEHFFLLSFLNLSFAQPFFCLLSLLDLSFAQPFLAVSVVCTLLPY
jgi:hypothetical protein